MVGTEKPSAAEAIAESAARISDSKGLAAIGEGLGWGIAAMAVALAVWGIFVGNKWDGRLFPEPRCFEILEISGRNFKLNTCTGDIIEIDFTDKINTTMNPD